MERLIAKTLQMKLIVQQTVHEDHAKTRSSTVQPRGVALLCITAATVKTTAVIGPMRRLATTPVAQLTILDVILEDASKVVGFVMVPLTAMEAKTNLIVLTPKALRIVQRELYGVQMYVSHPSGGVMENTTVLGVKTRRNAVMISNVMRACLNAPPENASFGTKLVTVDTIALAAKMKWSAALLNANPFRAHTLVIVQMEAKNAAFAKPVSLSRRTTKHA